MSLRAIVAWLMSIAIVSSSLSAVAQPLPGDRAVALGRQGVALYDAQQFADAHERFALAERESHSPVFVMYMARCRAQLADLLAARSLYLRVTSETIAPGAPDAWRSAQTQAATELAALEPRVPSVRIRVSGGPATVIIGDRVIGDAELAGDIALNPGEYRFEARSGDRIAHETIALGEGERRDVALKLPPLPAAEPSVASGADWTLGGAILLGVAGVAVVAGSITGGVALSITSDIKERCIDDSCLREDEQKGDKAGDYATVSTISFIIGGVAAAAGGVLLLLPVMTDDSATETRVRFGVASAAVELGW